MILKNDFLLIIVTEPTPYFHSYTAHSPQNGTAGLVLMLELNNSC